MGGVGISKNASPRLVFRLGTHPRVVKSLRSSYTGKCPHIPPVILHGTVSPSESGRGVPSCGRGRRSMCSPPPRRSCSAPATNTEGSQRDWHFIAKQLAPEPHPRGALLTVPRVGRSCEQFPDGFFLHLLHATNTEGSHTSFTRTTQPSHTAGYERLFGG